MPLHGHRENHMENFVSIHRVSGQAKSFRPMQHRHRRHTEQSPIAVVYKTMYLRNLISGRHIHT